MNFYPCGNNELEKIEGLELRMNQILSSHLISEEKRGALLLAIVQAAKSKDLDPERALRTAVRDLSDDIRKAEVLAASDAGVIGVEED